MLKILNSSIAEEIIHENAYEILRMLSYGAKEGIGFAHGSQQLKDFIKDKEITGAIWVAAMSRPVQYRAQSAVRDIRQQFIDVIKSDEHLPWPDWLEKEE